jgi:DNA-binding beta-propeller fold protein YncE
VKAAAAAPVVLLALSALGLGSCVTTEERPETAPAPLVWPGPPAEPRFAYEATLRTSADIEQESDAERLQRILGGAGDEVVSLVKPYGIAAGSGMIYVTDTVARLVHAFDLGRRRYFQLGLRLDGRLKKPAGIAVDGDSRVYVADVSAKRVVVYDRLGLFLGQIGAPEDFDRPTGVAVNRSGSRVYVVDTGGVESERHRVLVYDAKGSRLAAIGRRGSEPGEFNLPVAAATAPDGTLYVVDAGNFRVQAFDPEGRFLRAFGSVGNGYGQFARPRGIAVDGHGHVYVTDAAFGNVQVFDAAGRLLLPIGQMARRDAPGRWALASGVATDERGFVYVLDQLYRKIDVLRRLDEPARARPRAGSS